MPEGSVPVLERWWWSRSDGAPPPRVRCKHRDPQCFSDRAAPREKRPGEQRTAGRDQVTLEAFEGQRCKEQEPGAVSEGPSRDGTEADALRCRH